MFLNPFWFMDIMVTIDPFSCCKCYINFELFIKSHAFKIFIFYVVTSYVRTCGCDQPFSCLSVLLPDKSIHVFLGCIINEVFFLAWKYKFWCWYMVWSLNHSYRCFCTQSNNVRCLASAPLDKISVENHIGRHWQLWVMSSDQHWYWILVECQVIFYETMFLTWKRHSHMKSHWSCAPAIICCIIV